MNSSTFDAMISLMTSEAAVTLLRVTVTSTEAEMLLPSMVVAVMTAVPWPTAAISPDRSSTVATRGLSDFQVSVFTMALTGVTSAFTVVFSPTISCSRSRVSFTPVALVSSPKYSSLKLSKMHQLEYQLLSLRSPSWMSPSASNSIVFQ